MRDARWRWAWLVSGGLLWLLAVHGRFDIAVAAWLAPVFLLRFVRLSPAFTGLFLVWVASAAAGLFWMAETVVPMTPITVLGVIALGTLTIVPCRGQAAGTGERPGVPAATAACGFLMTLLSPFGTAFGVPATTQHDNLALLQVITLIGSYGVSFLIGWFASVANQVWGRHAWTVVASPYAGVMLRTSCSAEPGSRSSRRPGKPCGWRESVPTRPARVGADLLDGRDPLPNLAFLRREAEADLEGDRVMAMIAAAFVRSW
ncbi:hypothetical protein [Microtetraspora malaysiensis]|uniref:Apolipoprotein N-acyltransferase N-terminal domain-containing protein n=1 Tax=Microtetraspora malaysiensis TaxID=161358 RepID=A0ABW6T3Y5_9ACTN